MTTLCTSSDTASIPSDRCGLEDLALDYRGMEDARPVLALERGWAAQWTTTWKAAGGEVVCPVHDLPSMRVAGCRPVRRFSWRTGQRHRPGLQFMVSTGRHHGFESIAEQRLLLALDFAGQLVDVLAQPFRLRFGTAGGWHSHIPDFLAVTRGGAVLIDVRPGDRVGDADRVCFAASAEVAVSCGWRYLVATGWRAQVVGTLDTLSSQRRRLADPLGLQAEVRALLAGGPVAFGEVAAATSLPAAARAHLLHMIWHRQVGIDLAQPLADRSPTWLAAAARW